MYSIAKRTAAGAGLLLMMPVTVWLSGWQWTPGGNSTLLYILYGITETVSQPWGIVTHLVLCGWCLWCLRFRLKPAIVLVVILSSTILLGQGVKSWIKERVQEPRPFVVWLEKTQNLPVDDFYALKRKARGERVQSLPGVQASVPDFLRQHWQKDTGFAFPSGHTLFAASWALLGVGLLWPRRRRWTTAVLLLWATGVMGSRLLLGMHWPRDLVAATCLSWLLATIAIWITQRLCGPLTRVAKDTPENGQSARES